MSVPSNINKGMSHSRSPSKLSEKKSNSGANRNKSQFENKSLTLGPKDPNYNTSMQNLNYANQNIDNWSSNNVINGSSNDNGRSNDNNNGSSNSNQASQNGNQPSQNGNGSSNGNQSSQNGSNSNQAPGPQNSDRNQDPTHSIRNYPASVAPTQSSPPFLFTDFWVTNDIAHGTISLPKEVIQR